MCLLPGSIFTTLQWVWDSFSEFIQNGRRDFRPNSQRRGWCLTVVFSSLRLIVNKLFSYFLSRIHSSNMFFEFFPANKNPLLICCRPISIFNQDVPNHITTTLFPLNELLASHELFFHSLVSFFSFFFLYRFRFFCFVLFLLLFYRIFIFVSYLMLKPFLKKNIAGKIMVYIPFIKVFIQKWT